MIHIQQAGDIGGRMYDNIEYLSDIRLLIKF